nr:MAG TPA: hypothetical protein [Herelleviridae sp.]
MLSIRLCMFVAGTRLWVARFFRYQFHLDSDAFLRDKQL